ncbi:MAG TPA: hypothetical protein VFG98_02415 [Intrasporangium sp.]|nr:hypothetical protein [Intrasporangium sp.]
MWHISGRDAPGEPGQSEDIAVVDGAVAVAGLEGDPLVLHVNRR